MNFIIKAWEELWQKSGFAMFSDPIYTDSNPEIFKMSQRLYSSFYNLYANLPFPYDGQFYGLSPCNLNSFNQNKPIIILSY
jgi:hypothetical protein